MSSDVAEMTRASDVTPIDWREVSVADVVTMLPGFAFKSENFATETEAGLPLIRIRDLGQTNTATRYVGDYDEAFAVQDHDILVGMDGSFEAVRWRGGKALLNQRVLKLSSAQPSAMDEGYLFYRVQPALVELEQTISGTTVKHLSTKDLRRLSWQLPPVDEQWRIAEVLRSVDEAIMTANRVALQASEAFEALLADLFSRYGDASAKLEGYCIAGGLQTGPFGSQLKADDYVEEGIPIIMPVDLKPEGMDFVGAKKAPTAKSRELARHILQSGDVLFARRGEIGRCGLYLNGDPAALCGTGCLRARLDSNKIDPALAYFLIQSRQARDWLCAHAVGATMPNLNTTIIGDLPMPDIPKDEQGGWVDALLMIEGTRRINQRTLASFQKVKSTLMADLLTGHVRVPA
jgi:type I restriction enzyme, S subunit